MRLPGSEKRLYFNQVPMVPAAERAEPFHRWGLGAGHDS